MSAIHSFSGADWRWPTRLPGLKPAGAKLPLNEVTRWSGRPDHRQTPVSVAGHSQAAQVVTSVTLLALTAERSTQRSKSDGVPALQPTALKSASLDPLAGQIGWNLGCVCITVGAIPS